MKILYVTDLHGDKNKYRKSLDIAIEKNISTDIFLNSNVQRFPVFIFIPMQICNI